MCLLGSAASAGQPVALCSEDGRAQLKKIDGDHYVFTKAGISTEYSEMAGVSIGTGIRGRMFSDAGDKSVIGLYLAGESDDAPADGALIVSNGVSETFRPCK